MGIEDLWNQIVTLLRFGRGCLQPGPVNVIRSDVRSQRLLKIDRMRKWRDIVSGDMIHNFDKSENRVQILANLVGILVVYR